MKSNKERVLEYINEFGSITSLEAFQKLGNTRLSASIFNLREEGYDIKSIKESGLNRYGMKTNYFRYYIDENKLPGGKYEQGYRTISK